MQALLWLAIALPLAGAAATFAFPRRAAHVIAPVSALAAAVPVVILLVGAADGDRARTGFDWVPGGALRFGLRLDGLSAAMAMTVAAVGLVVLVYSVGYFAEEPRSRSALGGLLGFLAAMQGLVLADGFLTLVVFWELVGAMSARLIAFNRDDRAAPAGAVRAFLTTRAADAGFYLAVFALFAAHGSLAFTGDRPDGALGAVVAIGLIVAAMGKSAQVPLQTWLAGAMAGPTPVSALLHSATMVAAGVYLVARNHDLLAGWPLDVAGWVGAVTAVAGAAIALAQDDLKRVLAGSTTSQLGLMFVGVAAGGPAVGIFHLIAHAAGKATLFLASGIFQHQRGSTRLADLEGAGCEDRVAFALFAVGAASIAAVPPLAAFWSKDAIAAAVEHRPAWLVLVLIAAAGSAAYLLRPALVLRRDAERRSRPVAGRAPMLAGVGTLAIASVTLGAVGEPVSRLIGGSLPPVSVTSVGLSVVALAVGAALVLARVRAPARVAIAAREQLYTTAAIRVAVERPTLMLAAGAQRVDRGIDRVVDGAGRAALKVAALSRRAEERGIDAAVDGLARAVGRSGDDIRRLQSGRLYEYLRDTVAGAAAVAFVIAIAALT